MSTTTPADLPDRRPIDAKPLSAWRLEWLRLVRSPRLASLMAVYLFFGLLGPVTARYMSKILEHAEANLTIIAGELRPVDGMTNFISQANQTALVVVIVVAAGALAFDARRGVSTFLRTRTRRMSTLVAPRFTISAAAAIAAYTLGTLGAWYETTLLIGRLPSLSVLEGWLCGSVYLVFAVAVTTMAASVARSLLGTVGLAVAILLVLPIAGTFPAVHRWLPSSLATAPVDLLGSAELVDYIPALSVAVVATGAMMAFALRRLQGREV
jgi:ABC-2 type transport system permease protein